MNNKKVTMYICIILIILILISVGYYIYKNIKNKKEIMEYIPEEEITEEQLRRTIVTLYFLNPKTDELEPEARQIDSKELIDYPYEVLISLLIEGPQNDNLNKIIPENTKLIDTKVENNVLEINFSKEFIEEQSLGKMREELIIKSIVKTVTELTEINKVAILVEGEINKEFADGELSFDKIFIRE